MNIFYSTILQRFYKVLPQHQTNEAPLSTIVAGEKRDSLIFLFPRALGSVLAKEDNCSETQCKSAEGAVSCSTAATERLQQQQDTGSVKPQIKNDYPLLWFAVISKAVAKR